MRILSGKDDILALKPKPVPVDLTEEELRVYVVPATISQHKEISTLMQEEDQDPINVMLCVFIEHVTDAKGEAVFSVEDEQEIADTIGAGALMQVYSAVINDSARRLGKKLQAAAALTGG